MKTFHLFNIAVIELSSYLNLYWYRSLDSGQMLEYLKSSWIYSIDNNTNELIMAIYLKEISEIAVYYEKAIANMAKNIPYIK